MLKEHKGQNKILSYLTGIIFLIIIFSTIMINVASVIEKNKKREYISTSVNDVFKKTYKAYSEQEAKRDLVAFYQHNKGKYVKWTLKADSVDTFFDVVKSPLQLEVKGEPKFFVKCKFEKSIEGRIKKNQIITVSGQITGYSEFSKAIELKNCRVVN